jgi:transcriptional regulator with GAF, ATPase, and Fis domain
MSLGVIAHRYQFIEPLGEGGTGSVHRARDLADNRIVALKVLGLPADQSTARFLARSEFRILASQSHPGIVRVLDHGATDDGRCYLSMELLQGPDLKSFAAGEASRPGGLEASSSFARVVRQVLEALEHIHRRGLLHLDLKPANILVTRDADGEPLAKLIDFGLAGTASDSVSGTVEYLAPERLRGEPPDARSDLYSLGVSLHEALTGACPFRGATPAEVVRAHLESPVPAPGSLPDRYRSLVLHLLEKQPGKRPASARAALRELLGDEADARLPLPAFGSAFVGREDTLRALEAAARAAREGTPRSVLLRGPTGIGKSRLLRELEVRLQLADTPVALQAAGDGASAPAELLVRLVRRVGATMGTPAAALAGAAESADGAATLAGLDPVVIEGRRERLVQEAASWMLHAAAERPLVLLVDDAQQADSLSREALLGLLRAIEHVGGSRLTLVIAARADDAADQTWIDEILRTTRGFGSFSSWPLAGLSATDVERLLAQILGPIASADELARQLFEATGGNPCFIEESIKLLVRSGRLRPQAASWELAGGGALEVPRSVEEALDRGLTRFTGRDREVLDWAAVLDPPFTAEDLASLLPAAAGRLEAERALDRLALEEVLTREGQRYRFAHASGRAAVLRGLEPAALRRWHAAIAERLLASAAPDGPPVELLAHHLYSSDDPRRAREHLVRAGERAARIGALREAALHLSRALELTDGDRERFNLHLLLQDVHGLLGQRDEQRADLEALRSLAASLDAAARREVQAREGLYQEALGKKREALEHLERALASSQDDPRAEARLRVRSALLCFYLSDFDGGFARTAQALEAARALKDRAIEAECRQVAGLGRFLRGQYDEALAEMEQALAMRREEGEEHRAGALESNIGLIHLERGDLEAAEERFRASLKTLRGAGLRRGEAVNLLNLGLVHLELGKPERALDAIGSALRIRRELGDRRGEGADLGNLAAAWLQLGRPERAAPLITEALRLAREHQNQQSESANEHRLAQVELERGEGAKAIERLERAVDLAVKARLPAQELVARMVSSRAFLAQGQPVRAREQAEAALGIAVAGKMRRRIPGVRALHAAALLREGRLAEADAASRQAVAELERERGWSADSHLVWLERFHVLEKLGQERPAEEALRKAHVLLREKADAIQDDELRQGYLDGIPAHRELSLRHQELQARTRRESTRRERSFHEIARSIHSVLELDPLLDRLLELAIETTHAEKGLIALKEPGGDFTIRAARGMARESVEDAAEICRSAIADVAAGGGPVLTADAVNDERFRERRSIISFRIRTLMCVPMVVRDEIIGAVYVDGRGAASFDREDLEYLVSFAQLAAVAVENARLLEKLRAENIYLRQEVERRYRFENLIGSSPAMERLQRLLEKVAATHASVLVCGETGTGKEIVARSIHYASPRKGRPFVAVDCGALPESLLESELFGHRRGAFSGAVHDRVGLFEEADGGTIFLDEITNTSLDLQAKLLRVLQEGEVRRVGENPTRKVDVRVIVATNVDIRAAVEKGAFREDLYYRLNVVTIEVPPLRERREDIPELALHFLRRSCARHDKAITGFTEDAMAALTAAPWRGNVRELEHLVERAVILAERDRLDAPFLHSLLPPDARPPEAAAVVVAPPPPAGLPPAAAALASLTLEELDARWLDAERLYLQALVDGAGGNLAEAARRAQVRNRNTLISRLKRHGIVGKKG